MAQSGHQNATGECPLSGVKQTCPFALQMSANDPKRTSCTSSSKAVVGPMSNRLSNLPPQRLRKRALCEHTAAHRTMKGQYFQGEQISSASLRRTWTGSPCGSIKPAEDVGLVLQ